MNDTTHFKFTRKTGETLFIPNRYENYENFKEETITNRLNERLKICCAFKKLYDQVKENYSVNYSDLRHALDENEITIRSNANDNDLNLIFGLNYDRENIGIDHIINVALVLETRLDDQVKQQKLQQFIETVKNEKEQFIITIKQFKTVIQ